MHVSAKADYAVRAMVELAAHDGGPMKGEALAEAQNIPLKFLNAIMGELRRALLVQSQRSASGGYRLARPADQITLAQIIRAVEGPLAEVRGVRPSDLVFDGAAEALRDVWVAVRASLRQVLDRVTLADVVSGKLPDHVQALVADPTAWKQ